MFGRDRKVTLLRSSEWKRRFITGVETPACILTSRRDYFRTTVLYRGDAPMEFGAEYTFITGVPLRCILLRKESGVILMERP